MTEYILSSRSEETAKRRDEGMKCSIKFRDIFKTKIMCHMSQEKRNLQHAPAARIKIPIHDTF